MVNIILISEVNKKMYDFVKAFQFYLIVYLLLLQKLLPGTRRGCRVRRKPLVVQRPLLPREGMPRPLTFVHIVPSMSSLTNVIPTNSAQSETKINVPSPKNVVQILPSGIITCSC